MVWLPGIPLVVGAGVLGFIAAYILVLTFALPPLLAEPNDVARLSAGTFAIGYTTTFFVTLLSGAIWDATHVPATAFVPVLAAAIIVATLSPRLIGAALRSLASS
jgi:CP family cyanate transporter-like MFS transporter